MKLSLLLLTLVVSMATVYGQSHSDEELGDDSEREMRALIESLFGQQDSSLVPERCACLESLDLWAKTSTVRYAGSSGPHQLEVRLMDGERQQLTLTGLPSPGNSKLWNFKLEEPSLRMNCSSIFDVQSIAINAMSTDGWNINSAVTVLADSRGRTFTGSIDRGINAWVDHGDLPQYERLELTLAGHN